MCPQPPVKQEESKFDMNLKFISLLNKNTSFIGITGGEPTLIGDKLFQLFNKLNKQIPKSSILLLTNGIKFADIKFTVKFINHVKQDMIIDIPLYSDIDTIHNEIVRTKTFYKTIKGIYNLAKYNSKIGIRIVVHKMNYKRLSELSEYIYSNFPFVYHVAFMQMEPIGYAKENIEKVWIAPDEYKTELENAILKLYHRGINVLIYNMQLCILPEKIRHFAMQSISEWKRIFIKECDNCIEKSNCPGFFASSKELHSKRIQAITKT